MNDRYSVKIRTDTDDCGVITQTVSIGESIQRHVIDTRDAQVRKSLIELGWTPPEPVTGNDPN